MRPVPSVSFASTVKVISESEIFRLLYHGRMNEAKVVRVTWRSFAIQHAPRTDSHQAGYGIENEGLCVQAVQLSISNYAESSGVFVRGLHLNTLQYFVKSVSMQILVN